MLPIWILALLWGTVSLFAATPAATGETPVKPRKDSLALTVPADTAKTPNTITAISDDTAATADDSAVTDSTGEEMAETDTAEVESADDEDTGDLDLDSLARQGVKIVKPKGFQIPKYHLRFFPSPTSVCRDQAETVTGCLRGETALWGTQSGLPGTPTHWLDADKEEIIPWLSPYQAQGDLSPYGVGGLRLPDSLTRQGPAFSPTAIGEIWRPVAPLDTPMTRLRWQRGALAMNQFQVDLERALLGGSYFGLSYASVRADSQFFDYSFNVTQPYLSGWGFLGQIYHPIDRDSASLVLTGIAPNIEANQLRAKLGFWLSETQVLEVFYDRVRNRTNLGRPRDPLSHDSTFSAYPSLSSSDAFGALYGMEKGPWSIRMEALHSSADRDLRVTLAADSGMVPPTDVSVVDRWKGQVSRRLGPVDARLWGQVESENLEGLLALRSGESAVNTEGWRDGQTLGLDLHGTWLGGGVARGGMSLGRESQANAETEFLPQAWAETQWPLLLGFSLQAGAESRREDPSQDRLYRDRPSLNVLASPDLAPRWDHGLEAILGWTLARFSVYGGLSGHQIQNAWAPGILPGTRACAEVADGRYKSLAATDCPDTARVSDGLALRYRNYDEERLVNALVGLRFGLGNWKLWLENRYLIGDEISDADYLAGTLALSTRPERLFRGSLYWQRRLVSDRLGLLIGWDWEWVSTRYAWASNLDGTSAAVKLDEYLLLDFYASMKIKTFKLHFRAQNMNHDRYAPEPGVHPVGVNFRFGIDWDLFN